MGNKKVSVYITTYNRLPMLKRAISSVLSQTYNNIEVLICDDNSSDGTDEYCNELSKKDTRVRYFKNKENMGACYSRNIAIYEASGFFITGLDDDDEFTKDRLSIFVNSWDDKYSFICCDFVEKYPGKKEVNFYKMNNDDELTYKDLLFDNKASNQIFTTVEKIKEINGFDVTVKRLQDWDTWLRLSYHCGKFKRLRHATYIMNHDHSHQQDRVSNSYLYGEALRDLYHRNKVIYNEDESKFMEYRIKSSFNNERLMESILWSFKKKNVKFIAKSVLNFMKKVLRNEGFVRYGYT